MSFVTAYDTRTGDKLPHFVPERWIGHPALGEHLALTPATKRRKPKNGSAAKAEENPVDAPPTTQTPAAGDHEGKNPDAEASV